MIRAVPSWSLSLQDILSPGGRLHMGRDTLMQPRWVATVDRMSASEVALRLDEGDIADALLHAGEAVVLALGAVDQAMLYVSDVTIMRIESSLVVVSYPSAPRKSPRRSSTRVPLVWPCALVLDDGSAIMTSTVNVSASGALIAGPAELLLATIRPDDEIGLRIEVPERGEVALRARVVRVDRPVADRPPRTIALHYLDLPEVEEMKLQLAVLRAMARRYVRIRIALPCLLELEDGAGQRCALEGRTENVSGSGMLLRIPGHQNPATGQIGSVRVTIESLPLLIERVTVMRMDEGADGDTLVAINYSESSREVRSAIVEFVMESLRHV